MNTDFFFPSLSPKQPFPIRLQWGKNNLKSGSMPCRSQKLVKNLGTGCTLDSLVSSHRWEHFILQYWEESFFHHGLWFSLSTAKLVFWKLLNKQKDPCVMFGEKKTLQKAEQSLCRLYRTENIPSEIIFKRKMKTQVLPWEVFVYVTVTAKMHRFWVEFLQAD